MWGVQLNARGNALMAASGLMSANEKKTISDVNLKASMGILCGCTDYSVILWNSCPGFKRDTNKVRREYNNSFND